MTRSRRRSSACGRRFATDSRSSSPEAWAFRALYRLAMDRHRWSRRVRLLTERIGAQPAAPPGIRCRRTTRHLGGRRGTSGAPASRPSTLRFRADLPYEEIGAILGIAPPSARSNVSRALGALRSDAQRGDIPMNDQDLERRLRTERGPREDGLFGCATSTEPGEATRTAGAQPCSGPPSCSLQRPPECWSRPSPAPSFRVSPGPIPGTSPSPSASATASSDEPAVCGGQDLSYAVEPWTGAAGSRGTVVTVSLADGRVACITARPMQRHASPMRMARSSSMPGRHSRRGRMS